MKNIPFDMELSSLPILKEGIPQVELSLNYHDKESVEIEFDKFKEYLDKKKIYYIIKD